MGTYTFSGKPVFVTVGTTGTYDIAAFGAQGDRGTQPPVGTSRGNNGGYGAEEGGTVTLTAGERLEIVGDGSGLNAQRAAAGGGGGRRANAKTDTGRRFE